MVQPRIPGNSSSVNVIKTTIIDVHTRQRLTFGGDEDGYMDITIIATPVTHDTTDK